MDDRAIEQHAAELKEWGDYTQKYADYLIGNIQAGDFDEAARSAEAIKTSIAEMKRAGDLSADVISGLQGALKGAVDELHQANCNLATFGNLEEKYRDLEANILDVAGQIADAKLELLLSDREGLLAAQKRELIRMMQDGEDPEYLKKYLLRETRRMIDEAVAAYYSGVREIA